MCFMHLITDGIILKQLNEQPEEGDLMAFYKKVDVLEFKIGVSIAIFFNSLALPFLLNLIYRHIVLQRMGITTYEFIR